MIVGVAAVLRLWQLGQIPPSPDWDEAALGYNAYSIMTTGKDEYGKLFPVILQSFDDYKPALYAYLVIPFIKLIGLNTLAVRLPSAIFGIIAVISTYFLTKELFFGKKGEYLALLSAFLLAISPWHLQFSRIGFEAQVGLSLNLLAVLFLLKGLKKYYYLLFSAFFASLSIYVYQSEKVYLPILLLSLVIIFWREIGKIPKRWLASSVVVGIVLVAPMLLSIISNQDSLLRAKGVSVFSDQTQFLKQNAQKYEYDIESKDYLGIILDNRRFEYVKAITAGYIAHFDLNWLFINGDIERHHAPFMGLLYLFELPLILIGMYQLVYGKFSKKTKLTIFAIFLIAPIPASITSGVPHAVRTINFLPTFQIFTAIGILALISFVLNIKSQIFNIKIAKILIVSYFLFAIFNFTYYINQYFVQQNYYFSQNWQYGYKQAIDYIKPIAGRFDKIIVTNERPLDQSYIFFLFYLKYDPEQYQKSGGTVSGGFREEHSGFANYTFRPIDWEKDKNLSNTLFIGRPDDFPEGNKTIKKINYLDGSGAIVIVQN